MNKFYHHNRKFFLLSLVLFLYSLLVIPLLIVNVQKQQDTRGRADTGTMTTQNESPIAQNQTATGICSTGGEAIIGIAFSNSDPSRSMIVSATDLSTNRAVTLGTIAAAETKTGTIQTGKTSFSSGLVSFKYAFADNPNQTNSMTSDYSATSCTTATPTPLPLASRATCGNAPLDIMLIIDRSGSMAHASKLVNAKASAKNFIDSISVDTRNRIGLVSFSTSASLDIPLTNNFSSVKSKIDSLKSLGYTCQECAVKLANKEISDHGRTGYKKVVIMLTDGQANWIEGGKSSVAASIAEPKALDAIKAGFSSSKTAFFTIGLGLATGTGDDVLFSSQFLQNIASLTGGKYYFPAPEQLNAVYQEISSLVGKGIIGGFVFNDANHNKTYDQGEQKLQGWTIKLTAIDGTKTFTTSADGGFSATGLCDGAYSLKEVLQPGWTQMLPNDPNGYSITISNASSYTDKNFGNYRGRCGDMEDNDNNGFIDSKDSSCHTDNNPNNNDSFDPLKDGEHGGGNTCADSKDNNTNGLIDGGDPVCHTDMDPKNPNTYDPSLPEKPLTTLSLDVLLDGIGSRGDNSNPTANSLSNKNPAHKTKNAEVQVSDSSNQIVASGTGSVTYSSVSGSFKGILSTKDLLADGIYTVKVRVERYLRKRILNIQTIAVGKNNTISQAALVTGDIDNNNQLNILDYNLMLDCYSDLTAPVDCRTVTKKECADINDDNAVNQVDYNLFIREISTQPGV